MEHRLPRLEASSPRWRTLTIVVAALAVLELLVIVAAGVTLLGRSISQERPQAAPVAAAALAKRVRRAPVAPPKPSLPRADTSVLVLNGNGRTGAASASAAQVQQRGYIVGGVGNARRSDFASSVVMYRAGFRQEAVRLGRDVKVRIVGPLDGITRRELLGAHLALIVGN